jgi:hypothetical protein
MYVKNSLCLSLLVFGGKMPTYQIAGATFFSEFQVAECQNFDRHFTENGPNTRILKCQMFDRQNVRQVTFPNDIFPTDQMFDKSKFRILSYFIVIEPD